MTTKNCYTSQKQDYVPKHLTQHNVNTTKFRLYTVIIYEIGYPWSKKGFMEHT